MLVDPMLEACSLVVFGDIIEPGGELEGEPHAMRLLGDVRRHLRFGELHFFSIDLHHILVQKMLSFGNKTPHAARGEQRGYKANEDDMKVLFAQIENEI